MVKTKLLGVAGIMLAFFAIVSPAYSQTQGGDKPKAKMFDDAVKGELSVPHINEDDLPEDFPGDYERERIREHQEEERQRDASGDPFSGAEHHHWDDPDWVESDAEGLARARYATRELTRQWEERTGRRSSPPGDAMPRSDPRKSSHRSQPNER
jgi:hypothetical protein